MRLSSVLELARQYLLLGAIFAVFAAAAAVFGYFFVYKKTMKGEKALLFQSRELPFAARQYEIQSVYLFPELTA